MKNIEIILRQYAKQQGTIVRGTSDLSPLEEWLLSRIVKSTKDSAAEILEKHLLGGSYTDEEINKNLDQLSAMQEFAESYASQQMPFICTALSNLRSCSHYICGGCNHPSTCNYKKAQQMPSDDMSNIARRENYLITEKLIPSILSENVVNEEDYNLGWDDCFDWLKSLQQEKPNDKEK